MSRDHQSVRVALHRFGLGGRKGDAAAIAGDPRGHVAAQIAPGGTGAPLFDGAKVGLPSTREALQIHSLAELRRDNVRLGLVPKPTGGASEAKAVDAPVETEMFQAEVAARWSHWVSTEAGLIERLVWFWTNHFAVSVSKDRTVRAVAGAFEREAIRPHVLGRFVDMLIAVEQHPAMLHFLDNDISIGPGSLEGYHTKRGLNENLAREILELHTLGVDGGYSQDDVTSLAKVITGWTFNPPSFDLTNGGRFTFVPRRHEPGNHRVLGRDFADGHLDQGLDALRMIAAHPSTARFVATKLVRHFLSDDPPPEVVDRIARVFLDTDGDLRLVSAALLAEEAMWTTPTVKVRSPLEFLVALARAGGRHGEAEAMLRHLRLLGQPFWEPSGPNGFSDREVAWVTPVGMTVRLDIAAIWAEQNREWEPAGLASELFGASLSDRTLQAIKAVSNPVRGLTLLAMSTEFQRR